MNNLFQKTMLSLQLFSGLKSVGMLNPITEKMLLSIKSKSDPSHEIEMLNNLILIAKSFSSPFGIPDDSVYGPIKLALTENNLPIGIFPEDCHVLFAGQTGCGKSTSLRLTFSQAMLQNQQIWLFVRSQENRHLLRINNNILVCNFNGSIKFNPLNPCDNSIDDYCNKFSDIFVQSNTIYDGTKNYLIENLNELFKKLRTHEKYPSLQDLYNHIKSKKHSSTSRTAHYQESALNRLGGMLYGTLGKVFDCSIGHEPAFFNHNCIFEIDNLTTEQQRFIVNLLIYNLFMYRIKTNPTNWMFVGIDDANLIFDSSLEKRPDLGLPIIHHLLTTVRKAKINIFSCTQTPHQIGASIHSNAFVKVMFSLSNGKDIECMQQSMGIKDPDQRAYCYKLKPREAIIKFSARYQEPFLATIPEVSI